MISRGTTWLQFVHNGEHQRIKQVTSTNTIYYLTDPISGLAAEKLIGAGGSVTWTNYIGGAGGVCAMRVEYSSGALATRYFHKDHLGSIAMLTTETGAVDERLGYDASKRSLASPRRARGATPTARTTPPVG